MGAAAAAAAASGRCPRPPSAAPGACRPPGASGKLAELTGSDRSGARSGARRAGASGAAAGLRVAGGPAAAVGAGRMSGLRGANGCVWHTLHGTSAAGRSASSGRRRRRYAKGGATAAQRAPAPCLPRSLAAQRAAPLRSGRRGPGCARAPHGRRALGGRASAARQQKNDGRRAAARPRRRARRRACARGVRHLLLMIYRGGERQLARRRRGRGAACPVPSKPRTPPGSLCAGAGCGRRTNQHHAQRRCIPGCEPAAPARVEAPASSPISFAA